MFENRTIERIEKMLDSAMDGNFEEGDYDESRLSRLETKWKKYLATSQLAKNQLDATKRNLESLIADISHQTKTPMTNLKLYAELLGEQIDSRTDACEEERRLISEIRSQTDKLDFLIQSLTKMSRLESGMIEVKPEKADVAAFVKGVVDSMRVAAGRKQIAICLDRDNLTVDCTAHFDTKWTREALSNIIDNAVKYSPAASTVMVSIVPYEMYAAISVRDAGIGISEEESASIFERFYRGNEAAGEEGVGLGLYLAREILRKENGYIRVKSEVGKGSEFTLYLWRG